MEKKNKKTEQEEHGQYVAESLTTSHYDTTQRIEDKCNNLSSNLKTEVSVAEARQNEILKKVQQLAVLIVACTIGGVGGGLYVYKLGPSFLGMVPKSFGVESYSNLLATNLGLVESHSALEGALARAIEGMDRHADGEVQWQEKALAAQAECDAHCDAPAMKQFAFALAHDSSKALAAGCIVIPFDTWNEAFRGGFIETIVAAGNTRCVEWVKTNADKNKLSEREAELLREYKGGENRRAVNYRELAQKLWKNNKMLEEIGEQLNERQELIHINEVLMETLIQASPSFGPAY